MTYSAVYKRLKATLEKSDVYGSEMYLLDYIDGLLVNVPDHIYDRVIESSFIDDFIAEHFCDKENNMGATPHYEECCMDRWFF